MFFTVHILFCQSTAGEAGVINCEWLFYNFVFHLKGSGIIHAGSLLLLSSKQPCVLFRLLRLVKICAVKKAYCVSFIDKVTKGKWEVFHLFLVNDNPVDCTDERQWSLKDNTQNSMRGF